MATLIPSLSSCLSRMMAGEKRTARALEAHLAAECLVWYDVPLGPKHLHPDFILLDLQRGLLVLEVKDWKLESIQAVSKTSVTLLTPDGLKSVKNPLRQARDYVLAAVRCLERDAALVYPVGSSHQGKLLFPYGYGLVLANISRQAFKQTDLAEVFPPELVLCKDDIAENVDPQRILSQLHGLYTYQFGNPLTPHQTDRIRWHIFPDIRIGAEQLCLFDSDLDNDLDTHFDSDSDSTFSPPEVSIQPIEIAPDIIKLLDLQQEQLARSLGDGHRIIHGVAGSGKTLILVYRVLYLAQLTNQPILCLCFNVTLAAKLRQVIQAKIPHAKICVRHFHGWCYDLLKRHRLPLPEPGQYQGSAYAEELVHRVRQGVEQGQIPMAQYGALTIDEGHDFQPEWLQLAAQMVDPQTNSLLLLYDDAQNLYRKQRRKFTFKSIGIQAQGRSTILKLNYRNTHEILSFACEYAGAVLTLASDTEENDPVLVRPDSAGRHGPVPELVRLPSFKQEIQFLIQRLQQWDTQGMPWQEMAVLYRFKWMGEVIYQQLQHASMPVEWINQTSASRAFHPYAPSVKLMTLHASKGLEFPAVVIPGVGYLPCLHESPDDEAKLLYVGMTRALNQLVITYHQESLTSRRLQTALLRIAC